MRKATIHFTLGSFNPIFSVVTPLPNIKDKTRLRLETIDTIGMAKIWVVFLKIFLLIK